MSGEAQTIDPVAVRAMSETLTLQEVVEAAFFHTPSPAINDVFRIMKRRAKNGRLRTDWKVGEVGPNKHTETNAADFLAWLESEPRPFPELVKFARLWVECSPPPMDAAQTEAEPIYRTGAGGRPSSLFLVEGEMRRRAAAGMLQPSMEKEAAVLADWLIAEHRGKAPRMSAKTIKNQLGALYRQLRPK